MALMMAMAACQVAGRSLSLALLLAMRFDYAWKYYVADVGTILLYKIIRRDFLISAPLKGWHHIVASFIVRTFSKVTVDFTSVITFRNPQTLGGFYYTVNTVLGHISFFVITYLYCGRSSAQRGIIPTSTLWSIIALTSVSYFSLFVIYLSRINPGYGRTFVSFMTAAAAERERWMTVDDPEAKLFVFSLSTIMWQDFREEVKEYVFENFDEWENDKPRWWTQRMRARIPEDMIPEARRSAWRTGSEEQQAKKLDEKGSRRIVESIVELFDETNDASSSS